VLCPRRRGIIASEVMCVAKVSVEVPDGVLAAAGLAGPDVALEVRRRLSVAFYAEGCLTLSDAASMAGMGYAEFMEYLGRFGLGLNYGLDDLEQDLRTLRELGYG